MQGYAALDALHRGETVEVDGVQVRMDLGEIKPGDFYVGERSTGPHLLIARKIDTDMGCIFPEGIGYPYNLYECVKVCEDEPVTTSLSP